MKHESNGTTCSDISEAEQAYDARMHEARMHDARMAERLDEPLAGEAAEHFSTHVPLRGPRQAGRGARA